MKEQFYVIDDVIPVEMQDSIEDWLLGDKLPWRFKQDVHLMRKEIKEGNIKDLSPFLWITFMEDMNQYIDHGMMRKLAPIVEHACQKLDLELKRIIQGRTFLVMPLAEHLRKKYVNIHVDSPMDHLVCLYYANDSDGETVLFDKTTKEVSADKPHNNEAQFTEIYRVAPKKGRCLVFNGNMYHSASSPALYSRCVVNFNFLIR